MHKVKFVGCNDRGIEYIKPVEVYVNIVPTSDKPTLDTIRVICLREPNAFLDLRPAVMQYRGLFDYVLTFDEALLNTMNEARFIYPTRGAWVDNFDMDQVKSFTVSFICGGKLQTYGHQLRHHIWYNAPKISLSKKWYISSHYPGALQNPYGFPQLPNGVKNSMFHSQFHITVENSKQLNYFTEKIMDCFVTKTIPIYYGCPNISKWFNPEGIICFNDLEELIQIVDRITPDTYEEMKEYVNDNYKRASDYCATDKGVGIHVMNILASLHVPNIMS